MYLEKKKEKFINEIKADFMEGVGSLELNEEMIDNLFGFAHLLNVYSCALDEINTKFQILNKDLELVQMHNPIHHIEHRVKNMRSLVKKLKKRNMEITPEAAKESIMDIAGVRVICNYIQDIYDIEALLLKQEDVKLIERKDYVKNPKPNGYMSYHLIVSIPVFLSNNVEHTPVEIQFRTIGMDMWASLEHKLKYKNSSADTSNYEDELKKCAEDIFTIENKMQTMFNEIY